MKTHPTRSTALVAGAGSRLSFTLFEMWTARHPAAFAINEQIVPLFMLLTMFFLWVAPLVLFVYGFDSARLGGDRDYPPPSHAEVSEMWVRGVFWLIGSVVAWISTALAL